MIAKVVAWGETRETARHRLIEGLKDTVLFGLTTNRGFLVDVLEREAFARGEATTAFIADEFAEADLTGDTADPDQAAMASVLQYEAERKLALSKSVNVSPALLNWSSGDDLSTRYIYGEEDDATNLTVTPRGRDSYEVRSDETTWKIDLLEIADATARIRIDGRRQLAHFHIPPGGEIWLSVAGKTASFQNRIARAGQTEAAGGSGRVTAPMHGTLLELLVQAGDTVKPGDRLAVLEAMKMQHDILAETVGTVTAVHATAGNQTAADTLLIEIEETE
jgi:geranyl-CoA carboxylase alpha subunit